MTTALMEKLAAMDSEKFERWLKRNGYSGMGAFHMARKRKEYKAKQQTNEAKKEK